MGKYTFGRMTYYVCAEQLCNSDEESAKNSIKNYTPDLPKFVPFAIRNGQSANRPPETETEPQETTTPGDNFVIRQSFCGFLVMVIVLIHL